MIDMTFATYLPSVMLLPHSEQLFHKSTGLVGIIRGKSIPRRVVSHAMFVFQRVFKVRSYGPITWL